MFRAGFLAAAEAGKGLNSFRGERESSETASRIGKLFRRVAASLRVSISITTAGGKNPLDTRLARNQNSLIISKGVGSLSMGFYWN
jgi:hypothetical protein